METLEDLSAKIDTTEEIRGIVRTMKALSAVSIRQYDAAMEALRTYDATVDRGLQAVLRAWPEGPPAGLIRAGTGGPDAGGAAAQGPEAAVVFGSDRGLCGRFNERIARRVAEALTPREDGPCTRPRLLVVGVRAGARLASLGLRPDRVHTLPGSAAGLTGTAQTILVQADCWRAQGVARIRIFHNRRRSGVLAEPVSRVLVPVPQDWLAALAARPWPGRSLPMIRMAPEALFSRLIREHLLVSLFRAGAESLASEHAARLAAMKGAERNIEERLEDLSAAHRRQRQEAITTELMDIVTGVEAMRARASHAG